MELSLFGLSTKVTWLLIFVALYWSYCIFWGIKGAISAKTASDYFVAGRGVSLWVFVLAATATSFSGWTFVGHPGSIYSSGFQYAYATFYAITIPFTGVMFLKRQWILGKRFGFVTPGEMLSYYFRSDLIRLLVIVVTLIFSVPYLGIQLRASGFMFFVLTDGLLGVEVGMWVLSLVVFIYVASGGLKAVAYVDSMQAILLAVGIVIIGVIGYLAMGGPGALSQNLALLASDQTAMTPQGYPSYMAVPGVIQFVDNGPSATGGAWTGIMILTYMFALMGIQSSPAFSMWAFSNKDPSPFAPQQVWASAFGIGLIMFTFTTFQGLGFNFVGGNTQFIENHPDRVPVETAAMVQENLMRAQFGDAAVNLDAETLTQFANTALEATRTAGTIPTIQDLADTGSQAAQTLIQANGELAGRPALVDMSADGLSLNYIVPSLINLMADAAPWLVGLLAVCALAAMQSTGAGYMSTASGMLTRDLIRHFLLPNASHATQKLSGRIFVAIIVGLALVVATTATDALVLLGGLAVAYGFQMWPALIAVCYWPFLTRQGVCAGLITGLIAVTLTETIGVQWFATEEWGGWGRWPLTIHSAGWGIICNLSVAILVSIITRDDMARKMEFHSFLRRYAGLSPQKQKLIPVAWVVTLLWFFFAIGPGAVIGNDIFGNPNDPSTWLLGLPSIWTWQLIFWVLGVVMMWFLAYKMEMSTVPREEIEVLSEDYSDVRATTQAAE